MELNLTEDIKNEVVIGFNEYSDIKEQMSDIRSDRTAIIKTFAEVNLPSTSKIEVKINKKMTSNYCKIRYDIECGVFPYEDMREFMEAKMKLDDSQKTAINDLYKQWYNYETQKVDLSERIDTICESLSREIGCKDTDVKKFFMELLKKQKGTSNFYVIEELVRYFE